MTNNNLERYENQGLELFINTETGEAFASQSALARMCEITVTSLKKWKKVTQIEVKNAEVPTTTGLKTVTLYDEDAIYEALKKYNTDLLMVCAKAGLRVYLHRLAGFDVSSSAVQDKTMGLHPLVQQAISDIEKYQPLFEKYRDEHTEKKAEYDRIKDFELPNALEEYKYNILCEDNSLSAIKLANLLLVETHEDANIKELRRLMHIAFLAKNKAWSEMTKCETMLNQARLNLTLHLAA